MAQEVQMKNAVDERSVPSLVLRSQLISLARFRQIPTFGVDTIRKFSNNISETKQLAARDFEDALQVSIVYLCDRR